MYNSGFKIFRSKYYISMRFFP